MFVYIGPKMKAKVTSLPYSKLMLSLSNDKDQRKKSVSCSLSLNVNEP